VVAEFDPEESVEFTSEFGNKLRASVGYNLPR